MFILQQLRHHACMTILWYSFISSFSYLQVQKSCPPFIVQNNIPTDKWETLHPPHFELLTIPIALSVSSSISKSLAWIFARCSSSERCDYRPSMTMNLVGIVRYARPSRHVTYTVWQVHTKTILHRDPSCMDLSDDGPERRYTPIDFEISLVAYSFARYLFFSLSWSTFPAYSVDRQLEYRLKILFPASEHWYPINQNVCVQPTTPVETLKANDRQEVPCFLRQISGARYDSASSQICISTTNMFVDRRLSTSGLEYRADQPCYP
jgi:hypothetical protein